jgi:acetyl esterase/lipase
MTSTHKNIFILLLLIGFGLLFPNNAIGQCDYSTSRYGVQSELDIVYGIQSSWSGNADTLKLDIYKPVGDNNKNRPVLFLVHGGGFSGGNKNDVKTLCQIYASRGVVAVAVGYRLGFVRPLQFDYPYVLDQAEIFRAIYRSQQDTKGAIRFVKNRFQTDSTDINQAYIGGFSAGGIISLCVGYYTDSTYKYSNCGKIGNAVNLNGSWARPDLGNVDGHLNFNGQNAEVKGVFNFFGAVSDTSFIFPGTPKLFQYHQTNDPVVPCSKNKPYWGLGLGIPDNYGVVYGSCQIENRLKNLGSLAPQNETYIYNGNEHTVHDPLGIDIKMADALEDWVCQSMGSADNSKSNNFKIYPNPSYGTLNLENLPNSMTYLMISDSKGSIIKSYWGYNSKLDIKNLAPGIYSIQIIGDNYNGIQKFIVQ